MIDHEPLRAGTDYLMIVSALDAMLLCQNDHSDVARELLETSLNNVIDHLLDLISVLNR